MSSRLPVAPDPVPGTGKVQLVYILAASHSGSTLLAMLLNAHPEVCTVGELKATSLGDPARYRCSCQRLIRECPFWLAVNKDLHAQGFEFDITNAVTDIRSLRSVYVRRLLRPLHRGRVMEAIRDIALFLSPVWRDQLPRIQKLNVALMRSILKHAGKRIIADSSKVALRLKYLLRNPEVDVRIIRLIRDGRGVALTYVDPARFADARNPTLRGGGMGGDRQSERLPMTEAAYEWRRSNEEAEAAIRDVPDDRFIEVRYEELCASPEKTMARLFAFLGVQPVNNMLAFRNVEHHVVGNGMRLDDVTEIRLDERWREELTADDLEQFDAVAGDLNRKLGYQ
jgi:hypothetical protein